MAEVLSQVNSFLEVLELASTLQSYSVIKVSSVMMQKILYLSDSLV